MFPLRTQPRAALVGLAQAGWSAVTSPDPRAIERLLDTDTSAMPFLAAALRRHLQEFPEPRSGLSRTDRQLLETNGDFKASQAREEAPFMTEFFFGLRIEELQDKGLLGGGRITDRGRACLEGQFDHRSQADPRWVGGVLLEGLSCYRWDGARIVAP
jgi:hypothetical protein